MQIIENSIFGLRSVRMLLESRTSKVAVTLFPMIHLGEPAFYDRVYKDACEHDIVLIEGLISPISKRITRAYRWVAGSKRIGLMVQPRFPPQTESRATIIRADLTHKEFLAHWRRVPFYLKIVLYFAAPIFAIWMRLFWTRARLAKTQQLDDLSSRDETLHWDPEFVTFRHAIEAARDECLIATMSDYLDTDTQKPLRLSIVYGAHHMRAVLKELYERRGYRVTKTEWMLIFAH